MAETAGYSATLMSFLDKTCGWALGGTRRDILPRPFNLDVVTRLSSCQGSVWRCDLCCFSISATKRGLACSLPTSHKLYASCLWSAYTIQMKAWLWQRNSVEGNWVSDRAWLPLFLNHCGLELSSYTASTLDQAYKAEFSKKSSDLAGGSFTFLWFFIL